MATFSYRIPDGFHWKPYSGNPVGPFLEMAGVARHGNLYLVSGQPDFIVNHPVPVRRLATFASADFEHWSAIGAVGLDQAPTSPAPQVMTGVWRPQMGTDGYRTGHYPGRDPLP